MCIFTVSPSWQNDFLHLNWKIIFVDYIIQQFTFQLQLFSQGLSHDYMQAPGYDVFWIDERKERSKCFLEVRVLNSITFSITFRSRRLFSLPFNCRQRFLVVLNWTAFESVIAVLVSVLDDLIISVWVVLCTVHNEIGLNECLSQSDLMYRNDYAFDYCSVLDSSSWLVSFYCCVDKVYF